LIDETSSRDVLVTFFSPLSVLSSFSMTWVILSATSLAAAPGSTVTTTTWGGTVFGNRSVGVRKNANAPSAATSSTSATIA